MFKRATIALSILLVGCFVVSGFSMQQGGPVDRKTLRQMLEQLGYDVKDLVKDPGKEKYTVTLTEAGLDIPVGFEISPSETYIWLTVNLGDAPAESSARPMFMLKQNSKIQPTFFYVTDAGRLMVGLPIENRGVTNAILRQRTETIVSNVGKTKEIWQK